MEAKSMPRTQTRGNTRVLIASSDLMLAKQFAGSLPESFSVATSSSPGATLHAIENDQPEVVLIDPDLFSDDLAAEISAISAKSPGIRIMVIEDMENRRIDQYALFKAGAHGFCNHDISGSLLARAVKLVCEGEFWIQRKLIAQVISELSRDAGSTLKAQGIPGSTSAVDILTPRELEVARMVHMGGNNKMIARQLDISERTVKAHLSAIFRKLNIENRLHLALFFNQLT